MNQLRQILLVVIFSLVCHSVNAQNETDGLIQNLQTANFNNLLPLWDTQVEASFPDIPVQKQYSAREANELLKLFFNKNNIVGFEKNAERKVGNTIYLTGKLLSGSAKFNLTLLLQENKKGYSIVSIRVN